MNWAQAILIATLLGGAVATFARIIPAINNALVPRLTVLATILANVWLVARAFLEAAGVPVSWLDFAPPSDGGVQALAGWGLGSILQFVASVLLAIKAQYPIQRAGWEVGERVLFYPEKKIDL